MSKSDQKKEFQEESQKLEDIEKTKIRKEEIQNKIKEFQEESQKKMKEFQESQKKIKELQEEAQKLEDFEESKITKEEIQNKTLEFQETLKLEGKKNESKTDLLFDQLSADLETFKSNTSEESNRVLSEDYSGENSEEIENNFTFSSGSPEEKENKFE
jgi:hypothetical protein